MNIDLLKHKTRTLAELNQLALKTYQKVRETNVAGDFFQDVKPFADRVKALCDEWLPLAVQWVEETHPKHLHSIQLKNASENIQMVSVRAYYPETSLKKFNSHIQSVDFVLNRLLEVLDQAEEL
ncbi:YppE family protein [Bacillus sp. FJAT-49736]|uniref:YppE family protein n=1 Tax=Bacillus sp. FJAT-49736 TaxID=2833582 RepID=UPI001BC953F7|nr:YppE family protein [Bacillus sp. FJAT-49736]MBS4173237.1 YppE family protein [Bacillus sp. FJAT-49736]